MEIALFRKMRNQKVPEYVVPPQYMPLLHKARCVYTHAESLRCTVVYNELAFTLTYDGKTSQNQLY
jgi:hypothetical protein